MGVTNSTEPKPQFCPMASSMMLTRLSVTIKDNATGALRSGFNRRTCSRRPATNMMAKASAAASQNDKPTLLDRCQVR